MTIINYILCWLLLGSLTFGFAVVNDRTRKTYWTLVKCTIMGLLSFIVIIIHIFDDREFKYKRPLRVSIVLLCCLITITSCNDSKSGKRMRVNNAIAVTAKTLDYWTIDRIKLYANDPGTTHYYYTKTDSIRYILVSNDKVLVDMKWKTY